MASGVSQTYTESKVQFRGTDGDVEDEDDSEDVLDPRVKVITVSVNIRSVVIVNDYNTLKI